MSRMFGRRTGEQEQRDELLSAYLDGQLSAEEQARLEARLAADPALKAELDALRRTVALVRDLPPVPVPRNFILPQEAVRRQPVSARPQPAGRRRRAWAAPFLTAATAVSSLLFVVILAGDLLFAGARMGAFAPAPEAALEAEAPQAAMEPLPAAATVVVEAEAERAMPAPTTLPMPTEAPKAEPAEAPVEAIAEAPAEAAETLEEEPAEETGADASTAAPPAAGGAPIEEPPTPAATASPHKAAEVGVKAGEAADEAATEADSDRATADADRASEAEEGLALASQPLARRAISPWRIAEVILGLLTLGLGLVTVWAWRRAQRASTADGQSPPRHKRG